MKIIFFMLKMLNNKWTWTWNSLKRSLMLILEFNQFIYNLANKIKLSTNILKLNKYAVFQHTINLRRSPSNLNEYWKKMIGWCLSSHENERFGCNQKPWLIYGHTNEYKSSECTGNRAINTMCLWTSNETHFRIYVCFGI